MKNILLYIFILSFLLSAAGCSRAAGAKAAEPETAESFVTDAFRRFYSQKAETDTEHDFSHMDLTVLDGMASSTKGTAVDTEELTIDVAEAIVSGNTAEVILRVTAKQLDSVLYDNGTQTLNNYRFGDEAGMLGIVTLGRRFIDLGHAYSYCDTDNTLAPNQFDLHYWIKTTEPFEQDVLSIPLKDFGYYKSPALFHPVYSGDWIVNIALDPVEDNSKMISVGKEIMVGGYRFAIDSIQVTPLACTVQMSCAEDETTTSERMAEIVNACIDGRESVALTLADGTVLDSRQLSVGGTCYQEYPLFSPWTLSFYCPVAVEDVVSLSFFGTDFSLRAEAWDAPDETAAEERTEELHTAELREFPAHVFVFSECFYDGTTLRLAYKPEDMIYPVKYGFSPDDVELYNMGKWYINTGWQDFMTPEDYARVEKMFREKDQCGFILRCVYLGDHIRLIDGTDLGPWVSQKEDGTIVIKYSPETVDAPESEGDESQIQISSLPPEALDRDTLDLVLTIRDVLEYHYKDGNNYYYGNETLGERTVTITVPRQ
jgi:hypothetical protein